MGSDLVHATSPKPLWLKKLTADSVAGTPKLMFDFEDLGSTGFRFVVVNTGLGDLTVTPEAAYTSSGPAETSPDAPQPFVVPAGEAWGDAYGVDEFRPYWRLWVDGTSDFTWGVLTLRR